MADMRRTAGSAQSLMPSQSHDETQLEGIKIKSGQHETQVQCYELKLKKCDEIAMPQKL